MPMQPSQRGPFPMRYAFVVQFAADTTLAFETMHGRIEHCVSGQATRFHSVEALLGFVTTVLREMADAESS